MTRFRLFFACLVALLCLNVVGTANAGTIPVVVDRVLPDHRPGTPVKFGVPFPRNTLKADERIQVLDDRNQVVPHQQLVTATWDPAGAQGVRWMLVDFLTDAERTYRIVFGPDLQPKHHDAQAIATLEGELIKLDSGFLKGVIDTRKADLLGQLSAQARPVVQADAERFSAFFVEHETRGIFRSDLDPKPTIILEETGPIRATVKMDGWYTNAASEKFCRYSIRAHFFRDRPDVKLEHTFIYTGLAKDDRIRSMGLQLPQKSGQRGHIWGDGDLQDEMAEIFTSTAKVVLDSPNHDEIELVRYFPAKQTRRRLASRANAAFQYGYAAVAIRDGWQQYPLGFEVNDGVMQVQLWPSGERLLDFSFDGYWWFLNEHQKKHMMLGKRAAAKHTPEALVEQYRQRVGDATGAAKTHEVWLSFHVEPREMNYGQHGGKLWREVQNPVIAHADLKWSTASRALDFCAQSPRDDANFPDEERYIDAMYPMVQQLTDNSHWYGWWDWGGYYQLPGYPTGPFKDTHGLNDWNRNRPKSHYGWGQFPWLSYFRTGDRKWLRYAQTYTLYSADRAFKHHSKEDSRFAGAEYHYDNSEIPWVGGYAGWPGGAEGINNLQSKDDYVYMYWLTGDRRPMDVLKMWTDSLGGPITPANEIGSQWNWKVGFERGNDIRNAGHQLHRLMMIYQATWDERCLRTATHVANSFAALQTEADVIAAEGDRSVPDYKDLPFNTAAGWAYEGLWLYYNVTGDARIKKTLRAFIERSVNYDGGVGEGYGAIRSYTYGYELTGDTLYLDLIRGVCDDLAAGWVTPGSWITGPKITTITLGRALGTLANAPQAWRDKNLPTNLRGRTLRFEYARSNDAASNAYFLEKEDRAWKFRLMTNRGGKFVLLRPDGQPAYESPMMDYPLNRKWLDIEVKPDGQTGTYTLRCVAPIDWKINIGEAGRYAQARIIRCDLPVVVGINGSVPTQRSPWDLYAPVWGRSLFFRPTQPAAVAHVAPSPGRSFEIACEGKTIATSAGQKPDYTGVYTVPLSDAWIGHMLELRLDRPADRYYKLPPAGSGTISFLWFDGVPPFVAANPEDYFVPATKP
jgi:hypothetical protein